MYEGHIQIKLLLGSESRYRQRALGGYSCVLEFDDVIES